MYKLHRFVDDCTFSGEPNELLALARTWWPRCVTEFGPVVVDGQVMHRTLIWETPELRAEDQNGERVCAILA